MKVSRKKAIKILSGKNPSANDTNAQAKIKESDFGELAKTYGFLKDIPFPFAAFLFVTKGGVLKSSLTLNLARIAAWHGIKTLVIGLDVQCDISRNLGSHFDSDDTSLDEALASIDKVNGLYQYFNGSALLKDLILPTDLAHLSYIPETPELATLEQALHLRPRREFWFKEAVIQPLKKDFDLILIDGAPSWSLLTTNALSACDGLISPVECKINNYRNLSMFRAFIRDFKSDMQINFPQVFVPTRLTPQRRLSRDIYDRYSSELPFCVPTAIKDSVQGEESSALKISVCEHAPLSPAAEEMRQCLKDCFDLLGQQISSEESHQGISKRENSYVAQP